MKKHSTYYLTAGVLALLFSMALATSARVPPSHHPLGAKHPEGYTCKELIETDIEYVPQLVYWVDGYLWGRHGAWTKELVWEPMEVDNVVFNCKQAPEKAVSEVKTDG